MKKIITILLLLSTLFACTKFEEGPKYSLLSKKKRIIRSWKISYLIDLQTNEKYTSGYDGWVFTIEDYSKYRKTYVYNKETFIEDGVWKFQDDTLVLIHYPNEYTIRKEYKILRLTTKELWLRDSLQEIHYVHLNHKP
jgi:hypothetical protein